MSYTGTYDRTIFYNPANRFCIISVKSGDRSIPQNARGTGRFRDHLIRFTAVGYELPQTDAVDLELDGEWTEGKYGCQLQVEQWREIIPQTTDGIQGYLASGLLKGIGEKTAALIVARFGVETLDILEHQPERLLEIRGITEEKLEDIKTSYVESRALRDMMTLLSPFKVTPKTALKIYQYFGPSSLDILKKSPFELCQISGFGFRRVDAIVKKTNNRPHDPMRIRGALFCSLDDARSKQGHLFLEQEELIKAAFKLLNEKIPLPELRVRQQEVETVLQEMILKGSVVLARGDIYMPRVFELEDTAARKVAELLMREPQRVSIGKTLSEVKEAFGIALSEKQDVAVRMAFHHNLSIITGSPGTGKTTVLKTVLEVFRTLYPKDSIMLMAPTGRASRRMAESTGFTEAKTLHSALGLVSEDDADDRQNRTGILDADLIVVDEFSMVDMWLAKQFFSRVKPGAKILLVGDADQLPSVGAGNVFHELIQCGLIPVTVLDEIFRQSKDSLIAYNAKFINEGSTKLYYGNDFVFLPAETQAEAAEQLRVIYCREIEQHGIERVQILSPFRSEGEASSDHLNDALREIVNPFRSEEEEIKVGMKHFRVGDRIMQNKNTDHVSNGDLGFIRAVTETDKGQEVRLEFSDNRRLTYTLENMANIELAYATTIHKAMGSEYDIVLIPVLKAHTVMLYRNLLYTAITRAKKRVFLIGQKGILYMAIHRNEISKRNTLLGQRITLYHRAFSKGARPELPENREELKNVG